MTTEIIQDAIRKGKHVYLPGFSDRITTFKVWRNLITIQSKYGSVRRFNIDALNYFLKKAEIFEPCNY